jgi:hypothetical protein
MTLLNSVFIILNKYVNSGIACFDCVVLYVATNISS